MDLGLKDKCIVVTGSSRGIGLAIAEGFLSEGARVVLTSRHIDSLSASRERLLIKYPSDHVLALPCDMTVPDEIKSLQERVAQAWGRLDVLVANVGSGKSVADPIPAHGQFEQMLRLNFDSAVYAAREFLPLLTASHGNILFISSIAGMEAFGAPVDYSVAKTAVLAFAKNISRKLAREGVRVNCLAPGNVFFPGGSWEEKINADPDRIKRLIESSVPMNRFGTPKEIADAALFLCSERASFITGSVLRVDGGQTVTLY